MLKVNAPLLLALKHPPQLCIFLLLPQPCLLLFLSYFTLTFPALLFESLLTQVAHGFIRPRVTFLSPHWQSALGTLPHPCRKAPWHFRPYSFLYFLGSSSSHPVLVFTTIGPELEVMLSPSLILGPFFLLFHSTSPTLNPSLLHFSHTHLPNVAS